MGTFGLASNGGNYFPSIQAGDRDFGILGPEHKWYYTLEYDEATNGFINFNTDDFKLFLSALLGDAQTFVIRTEYMRTQEIQNKVLFCFNIWKNKLVPSEVISGFGGALPGASLEAWDPSIFNSISAIWEDFMHNKALYLLHRFGSSSDFIDFLNTITYLNGDISNLGDPNNLNS